MIIGLSGLQFGLQSCEWLTNDKLIKGFCEQTRELTDDLHDFALCLMLSGLGNFVVDCHI